MITKILTNSNQCYCGRSRESEMGTQEFPWTETSMMEKHFS